MTAVLAALALALPATAATAAPKKPFTLTVTPTEVAAGSTTTFTVTLTNQASPQSLGSANITVPPGFTIVSAGGATVSGNVIQLRNLSLRPGGSVTLTVTLVAPCTPDTYTWDVVAKQANNFHGTGNDFGLASPLPTTTVRASSGAARLQFVNQPGDAATGARITAVDFEPNSGQLVTVRALDACGRPVANATIQLRLDTATGPVVATSTTNAAGLATFSIPGISDSDYHTLFATTGGFAPAESLPFQVIEAFPCGPTAGTCTATVSGAETTVTLTGSGGSGTGLLLLSLDFGPDPRCVGYNPPTPDWYEFGVTVERTKTADVVYDAAAVKEIGGVAKLQICFAALRPFTTKGAALQPFDYDGDPRTGPGGKEGWVGLLPDCPYDPREPCILKRQALDEHHREAYGHPSGGSRALVRVLVPLDWGDPRMH